MNRNKLNGINKLKMNNNYNKIKIACNHQLQYTLIDIWPIFQVIEDYIFLAGLLEITLTIQLMHKYSQRITVINHYIGPTNIQYWTEPFTLHSTIQSHRRGWVTFKLLICYHIKTFNKDWRIDGLYWSAGLFASTSSL